MASPPTLDGSVWLKNIAIMLKRKAWTSVNAAPQRTMICRQRSASTTTCTTSSSSPSPIQRRSIWLRRPFTAPILTEFSAKYSSRPETASLAEKGQRLAHCVS